MRSESNRQIASPSAVGKMRGFEVSSHSRLGEVAVTACLCIAVVFYGSTGFLSRQSGAVATVSGLLPDALLVVAAVIALGLGARVKSPISPAMVWLGLFTACAFLSWTFTLWHHVQYSTYGLRALTIALGAAVVIQSAKLSGRSELVVRRVLLGIILLNMAVALRQSITGLSAQELASVVEAGSSFQVGTQTRLIGLMSTGQDLSILAGASAVWAWARIASMGVRRAGPLLLLVGISASATTFLVLQRSALVGVATATVFLVAHQMWLARAQEGRWRGTALLGLLGLFSSALLVMGSVAPERIDVATDRLGSLFGLQEDYSLSVRQQVTIPVSLDLAAASPLGYGVGASGPVAASFPGVSPLSEYPLGGVAADNGYIFIFLQLGIFGTLAFVMMLASWLKWGGLYREAQADAAGSAVIAFLCGIMLTGTFWALSAPMVLVFALISLNARPDSARQESAGNRVNGLGPRRPPSLERQWRKL
jgi:hypothetical protein